MNHSLLSGTTGRKMMTGLLGSVFLGGCSGLGVGNDDGIGKDESISSACAAAWGVSGVLRRDESTDGRLLILDAAIADKTLEADFPELHGAIIFGSALWSQKVGLYGDPQAVNEDFLESYVAQIITWYKKNCE